MTIYQQMQEVLNDRGWIKGTQINEAGECCLLGAYEVVKGGEIDPASGQSIWTAYLYMRDLKELIDITGERLGDEDLSWREYIFTYNDRPYTKFEDVMSILQEAHNRKVS